MKYAAIAAHVGQFSVAFMCRELGVAPSGYYAWQVRPLSRKSARDAALLAHVRAAFKASRRRYGSPGFTPNSRPEVSASRASASPG